ncbi:MAG: hypothetical protein QJR00_05915 [Bacillota bacterium]|nr:hypothetical protein [Bacillota bacterium]
MTSPQWGDKLRIFVGATARHTLGRTTDKTWLPAREAVQVKVVSLFRVEAIEEAEGMLVIRGEGHGITIPLAEAYVGLDEKHRFFLAGWPEGEEYHYLRLSDEPLEPSAKDPWHQYLGRWM